MKDFYTVGGGLTPEVTQLSSNFNFGTLHVEYLNSGNSPNGLDWPIRVYRTFNREILNFRFYHLVDSEGNAEWYGKIRLEDRISEMERVIKETINSLPKEVTSAIVVNEPYIDPDRLNDPLYSVSQGYDYIKKAFEVARDTRPDLYLLYLAT